MIHCQKERKKVTTSDLNIFNFFVHDHQQAVSVEVISHDPPHTTNDAGPTTEDLRPTHPRHLAIPLPTSLRYSYSFWENIFLFLFVAQFKESSPNCTNDDISIILLIISTKNFLDSDWLQASAIARYNCGERR